jgi:hypothetical protein
MRGGDFSHFNHPDRLSKKKNNSTDTPWGFQLTDPSGAICARDDPKDLALHKHVSNFASLMDQPSSNLKLPEAFRQAGSSSPILHQHMHAM